MWRFQRRRIDHLHVRSEVLPLCSLQVVVRLLELSDVLLEVVSGRCGLGQVTFQRRDLSERFCVLDVVLLLCPQRQQYHQNKHAPFPTQRGHYQEVILPVFIHLCIKAVILDPVVVKQDKQALEMSPLSLSDEEEVYVLNNQLVIPFIDVPSLWTSESK